MRGIFIVTTPIEPVKGAEPKSPPPRRVGFQTPFTNVTLDFNVPSYFKDQGVIIGGQIQDKKYGEFQKEMDMFNKAFLEIMLEGDAKGRVFTFPIPTYNITKDFDWDNPAYQPLWEMTAKYGIPYFANFVNSDMNPEDARSMPTLVGTFTLNKNSCKACLTSW